MFKIKDFVNFFMPKLHLDMGGGGGGGGSAPANQTIRQENAVSAFAAPYVERMLGETEALTQAPYQPYQGQRTADFTGLQNTAFGAAGNLGTAQQTTDASNMANQAGIAALNTNYGGQQFGNAYQGLQAYNPGQYGQQAVQNQALTNYQMGPAAEVSAQQNTGPTMQGAQTNYNPNLQNYQMQGPADVQSQGYNAASMQAAQTAYRPELQTFQMGPAQQVSAQNFGGQSAQDYMSPYMQNVVDVQQREAQRTADIAGTPAKLSVSTSHTKLGRRSNWSANIAC